MKKIKRITAVIMAVIMAATSFSVAVFAADDDVDFTVTNPYESVDWDSWGQYKANMHTHSTVTDGTNPFNEMILKHYELDYDFLAMTDHSTVCYSWTQPNYVPAFRAAMTLRNDTSILDTPVGLTEEEYKEVTTPGKDGKSMLQVPFGIEQNGASFNNTHVCTWFADYGNGMLGATSDYESVLKAIDELGGLSVINHPGEYTGAKKENNPEKAYDSSYEYQIAKFANLLAKYPSCIGIDVNSKGDGRTKNDRKLWDLLLQRVIPTGRNVYAMATSDAHRDSAIDSGWTVNLMPEKSVDGLRTAMENGTFFAMSHFIQNTKELAILSSEIGEDLGTSWEADKTLPDPKVNRITVDDAEDTITLDVSNERTVHWISDGEVIAVGNSIDLDDYADELGCYVRAEVFGDGGILYTQAFILEHKNVDEPEEPVSNSFFDFGNIFRKLYDMLIFIIDANPTMRELHKWLFSYSTFD